PASPDEPWRAQARRSTAEAAWYDEPSAIEPRPATALDFQSNASGWSERGVESAEALYPPVDWGRSTPLGEDVARPRRWDWSLSFGPVVIAWALGALVLAGAHLRRIRDLRRLAAAGVAAPAALDQEVRRLAARIGVRPPRVRTIAGLGSPAVWCLG